MKRMIVLALVISMMTVPVYADWTPKQVQANQIANIARSMGLAESNPIISKETRHRHRRQGRAV